MTKLYKYPRTPHLPFSEGATSDDRILASDSIFGGKEVIVTYKMDGENTTVYPDGTFHARSLDTIHKDYHSWLLNDIQRWCYSLSRDFRVCGEYLYAKNSIEYSNLQSYFMAFSIWNEDKCLNWDLTEGILSQLGVETVPVIYKGIYSTEKIKELAKKAIDNGQEGIVVRKVGPFLLEDFGNNVVKFVRKNHVATDKHWQFQKIIPNGLKKKGA